ncbi:hypothetical protein [Nocardioides sp. WS12]|uniref:hypothetical protein n=1 Tax=Nocardioides sp. WS12 TaxID=2486272 RepID=UPI0015F805C0|nr:hypothetical protein [Nocardioides sp. WS12]
MGFNVVTNAGDKPAAVTDISLLDPVALTLKEAWLVPMNGAAVGDHSTFPPPEQIITAAELAWDHREPIPGATAARGVRYNLVLHLDSGSTQPSASGIRLTYEVDGEEFGWQSEMGLAVRDVC